MKTFALFALTVPALLVFACTAEVTTTGGGSNADGGATAPVQTLAPELGTGDKTPGSVTLTQIAGPDEALKYPTSLAFNPERPSELWITNREDNSMVLVFDAPTESRRAERRHEGAMAHFMDKPMGISFGAPETTFGSVGTFATCGESRNEMGTGDGKGNNFMGPVLWTSDLAIFTKKDPKGLGSHIDMLHSSPLCMGIVHEASNVYWAFGGFDSTIHRYDFRQDHDVGNDDHSDGEIRWYGKGLFARVENVPSHLAFRASDKMLFIADTGHARIALLDTKTGKEASSGRNPDNLVVNKVMADAVITDFIAADSGLVKQPSGLLLKGDYLYVADYENGRISAFNAKGERVNYLDTGLAGTLGGMTFGPDNKLYFIDMNGNRVLRIDPKK
ncbi:MAG: hypothetical protein U0174_18335 [Polyangiaceae bacterium]